MKKKCMMVFFNLLEAVISKLIHTSFKRDFLTENSCAYTILT